MMTYDFHYPEQEGYFHLCSDGALTPRLITCEEDSRVAFNLVGVCAANSDVTILSFSIEDTHIHSLMFGTKSSCAHYKTLYEESWAHHVGRVRGTREGADLTLEILPVDSQDYLMSVGTYTITQPTKDGKQILPYDYRWGTGSMYFRVPGHIPVWCMNARGEIIPPILAGNLSRHAKKEILCSHRPVPDSWRICNGILLPDNYVDVPAFEQIYRTANCFRVFLASNRNRDLAIKERIAAARGVALEDAEARMHCRIVVKEMFGFTDVRRLDAHKRVLVAQQLRKRIHLSARQIAALVRLPYSEVCKYI